MSRTTKSTLALARTAMKVGGRALANYSHPNSPKKFTQPSRLVGIRHPRHQAIPQNRLSRHDRDAYGMARTAQSPEAALCAALLDAVLR